MQLNLPNQETINPTNLSLHLLQELYGQYSQSLKFTQINDEQVSLKEFTSTYISYLTRAGQYS